MNKMDNVTISQTAIRCKMQFYDDILPVKGTRTKREPIRFRDAEKISKKKEHKNTQKRLTKRKWLDYNSPRDTNYDD